jgi:hypothetical protein
MSHSRAHYCTKGGNCTGHDDHFFYNAIALETLGETGVSGVGVKYVLLTNSGNGLFTADFADGLNGSFQTPLPCLQ